MATSADFRKSISEMSPVEQLDCILRLRAERRMIPEKKVKTKKTATKAKKPKKKNILAFTDSLGKEEKQLMLDKFMKLRKKR